MINDLPNTTVSKVAKALVSMREEGGAVALGRVLTLVIASPGAHHEAAIDAANAASAEHPMRVIVIRTDAKSETRLDAQIRVGGDAGASEVIVLTAGGETAVNKESLVTGLLLP
ncbi:MAG: glucose-6-phosphate dehydrogenase assembly protein OpcA, partial [Microbacterium sp.]